MSQTQEIL